MTAAGYDRVITGGTCVTPSGVEVTDVGLRDGRIAALGDLGRAPAAERIDATGLHVLPGVIDSQVHFRDPGGTHKEDLGTGTAAAVMGGVTAVFDMPNTKPATTTAEALGDKTARARAVAWCDTGFFVGATGDNADSLPELERLPGVAGVKLFMGSSTGDLLVGEDDAVARVVAAGQRRMAVHCEDEARLRERRALVEGGAPVHQHAEWRDAETARRATERLLRLAAGARRRVQVLHVTTAEEVALLADHKALATVEVTPQHLTLTAPDAYERLGTRAQMNPPIRDAAHQEALWRAVRDGLVDVMGSDHAPHTLDEKAKPYPDSPSGMPGVQTLVPLMLDHVNAGRLSLERLVDLVCTGPARAYGIAGKGRLAVGYDGDLTLVDLRARHRLSDSWIVSRCGWTPYDGRAVTGWPVMTVIRGVPVMREGALQGDPAGRLVRFVETL